VKSILAQLGEKLLIHHEAQTLAEDQLKKDSLVGEARNVKPVF